MASPSYARSTKSSIRKSDYEMNNHTVLPIRSTPPTTPSKLKRPSTLTPQERQSIAYSSSLVSVKPQDIKKPCLLATLSSELRTEIWSYLLDLPSRGGPSWSVGSQDPTAPTYTLPAVLRTCQAIRIEASYTYYTFYPFSLSVKNINFSRIRKWLRGLSPRHRELLAKNRNLEIKIRPGIVSQYTYPPKDFFVDAYMTDHWEACKAYGNLHMIDAGSKKQMRFIQFCRLLAWFQFCSDNPFSALRWRYTIQGDHAGPHWMHLPKHVTLLDFVKEVIGVLRMDWGREWTRGRVKGKGEHAAKDFLRQLDDAYREIGQDPGHDAWSHEMSRIVRAVEKW